MTIETHQQLASFIWSICDLLRGPYKRSEYRKVILPLTVLRRFDCLLEDTRDDVLAAHARMAGRPETVAAAELARVAGRPFYNTSPFSFARLLHAPNDLPQNLARYIAGFSPNVREIMERFAFDQQVARMAEKNLLYQVVRKFAAVDLSPGRVDNEQMGYVFEELIRIGAEQSNEEAGEHFTPREVIQLMVELLLEPDRERWKRHSVMLICDPACGTGGMLSMAEHYIRQMNIHADPRLFGQDLNDESWAVCRSDMLIKGENAENIHLGNSFTHDAFTGMRFDYMLANPPFGVEWKQQRRSIENERNTQGYAGRFGAGLPRISDGSFLFLQHMIHHMRPPEQEGSRIGIIFNGSPLFSGDAGSGESGIRRWIIENDWLEAVVGLPDQLFYNTGISTYVWILTNRKEERRRGKVQLIDARRFFVRMKKSLGNKRNQIEPDQIGDIAAVHGAFDDGETRTFTIGGREQTLVVSRVFDNEDFGYRKLTVERPLRLNFAATPERAARVEEQPAFRSLATSGKKHEAARADQIAAGERRQREIRALLAAFSEAGGGEVWRDRALFRKELKAVERARGVRLSAAELKAVEAALGERDETAEPCTGRDGRPEPDPGLRDTERVPLKETVDGYFAREVLPHVPDAWIDHAKTRTGYEIPFNRHFHRYEPPRPLHQIESEIRALESEIVALLAEVT